MISTAASRRLSVLLGIEHPVIQGPMAGGGSTVEMAAAVSNAGGLGSLGAAYLTPQQITEQVAELRRRTSRPFAVNLFTGAWVPGAADAPAALLAILGRAHQALGLAPPEIPAAGADPYPAQLEAVLAAAPPIFSFTFGPPGAGEVERLKGRGIRLLGTATTVEEAVRLEALGVDAVIAQGGESGGHRGTFAGPFEAAMIGTMALVPATVDAVSVPVIAAGGIMDGRGLAAALALGAAGAQLGTAFLTTAESGVPEAYKAALLAAREDEVTVTRAFSGRPARGLVNAFLVEAEATPGAILPYPLQNAATRPMRTAAARQGRSDYLSLWAGQGVRLARRQTSAELVARLVAEAGAALPDRP